MCWKSVETWQKCWRKCWEGIEIVLRRRKVSKKCQGSIVEVSKNVKEAWWKCRRNLKKWVKVSRLFWGSVKEGSKECWECVQTFARKCWERFKKWSESVEDLLRKCQGSVKEVSRKCQGSVKEVSWSCWESSGRELWNGEELQQFLQKPDWVSDWVSEWVRDLVVSKEAIASKNKT